MLSCNFYYNIVKCNDEPLSSNICTKYDYSGCRIALEIKVSQLEEELDTSMESLKIKLLPLAANQIMPKTGTKLSQRTESSAVL